VRRPNDGPPKQEQNWLSGPRLAGKVKPVIPTSIKFSPLLQDDANRRTQQSPVKTVKGDQSAVNQPKSPPPSIFPPGHPSYHSPGEKKIPNKSMSVIIGDSNIRFVGQQMHNFICSDFIVSGMSGCGIKDVEEEAIRIMKEEKLAKFDIQFFVHAGVNDVDPFWDNNVSIRSSFRRLVVNIQCVTKKMQSTAKVYILSVPPTKKHTLIDGIKNCDAEERIVRINSFLESTCGDGIEAEFVDVQQYQQGKYLGKDYLHYHPKGAFQVALIVHKLSQDFLALGTHRFLQET